MAQVDTTVVTGSVRAVDGPKKKKASGLSGLFGLRRVLSDIVLEAAHVVDGYVQPKGVPEVLPAPACTASLRPAQGRKQCYLQTGTQPCTKSLALAAASTENLLPVSTSTRVSFNVQVYVTETYGPGEYERSVVPPQRSIEELDSIREELNTFKETEMQVHPLSTANTLIYRPLRSQSNPLPATYDTAVAHPPEPDIKSAPPRPPLQAQVFSFPASPIVSKHHTHTVPPPGLTFNMKLEGSPRRTGLCVPSNLSVPLEWQRGHDHRGSFRRPSTQWQPRPLQKSPPRTISESNLKQSYPDQPLPGPQQCWSPNATTATGPVLGGPPAAGPNIMVAGQYQAGSMTPQQAAAAIEQIALLQQRVVELERTKQLLLASTPALMRQSPSMPSLHGQHATARSPFPPPQGTTQNMPLPATTSLPSLPLRMASTPTHYTTAHDQNTQRPTQFSFSAANGAVNGGVVKQEQRVQQGRLWGRTAWAPV